MQIQVNRLKYVLNLAADFQFLIILIGLKYIYVHGMGDFMTVDRYQLKRQKQFIIIKYLLHHLYLLDMEQKKNGYSFLRF